jgi:hypothetical protein
MLFVHYIDHSVEAIWRNSVTFCDSNLGHACARRRVGNPAIFSVKSGGAQSYHGNLKGRSRRLKISISKNTLHIPLCLRKYIDTVFERLRHFKLRLLYGLNVGFTLRSALRLLQLPHHCDWPNSVKHSRQSHLQPHHFNINPQRFVRNVGMKTTNYSV